eukprot:COSAG06_NODE_1243_length_10120_cov_29.242092_3_plen_457_part_00
MHDIAPAFADRASAMSSDNHIHGHGLTHWRTTPERCSCSPSDDAAAAAPTKGPRATRPPRYSVSLRRREARVVPWKVPEELTLEVTSTDHALSKRDLRHAIVRGAHLTVRNRRGMSLRATVPTDPQSAVGRTSPSQRRSRSYGGAARARRAERRSTRLRRLGLPTGSSDSQLGERAPSSPWAPARRASPSRELRLLNTSLSRSLRPLDVSPSTASAYYSTSFGTRSRPRATGHVGSPLSRSPTNLLDQIMSRSPSPMYQAEDQIDVSKLLSLHADKPSTAPHQRRTAARNSHKQQQLPRAATPEPGPSSAAQMAPECQSNKLVALRGPGLNRMSRSVDAGVDEAGVHANEKGSEKKLLNVKNASPRLGDLSKASKMTQSHNPSMVSSVPNETTLLKGDLVTARVPSALPNTGVVGSSKEGHAWEEVCAPASSSRSGGGSFVRLILPFSPILRAPLC